MNFKVGDRVRINYPGVPNHGLQATVMDVLYDHLTQQGLGKAPKRCPVICRVDVDGRGCINPCGQRWGYEPHELIPLLPPVADTWAADKVKQLVKPIHQEPAIARDNAVCW